MAQWYDYLNPFAGFGLWAGDDKKEESPQATFQTYDPYKAQRDKYISDLQGVMYKGYPELMSKDYWGPTWQQTGQDIMEDVRARRGLGIGSTPEAYQWGQAQRGLTSDLINQQIQARQRAAQMLGGAIPESVTAVTQPAAPEPSALQNLLSFATPIASSYAQMAGLGPVMSAMGFGPASKLQKPVVEESKSDSGDFDWLGTGIQAAVSALPFLL